MTYRLFLSLLLCGTVLAVVSCSDPAGVGANLGDTPVENDTVGVRSIPADSIYTIEAIARTGFESSPPPEQSSRWRFLFGSVDDPLSGPINAEGYVDFVGAASRDSAFSAASAEDLSAELRLQTTYVHGDTSSNSNIDLKIYDLAGEADMSQAPADTTFETEPTAIDSYRKTPTPDDSLLRFKLPNEWVEKHQDVLQDSVEFGDAFNGLKLSPSDANAVVGVEHASATLRVTTSQDTVDFQSLKSFTHLDRGSPSANPSGRTLLQDGVGQRLALEWDFDQSPFSDTLRNVPLNKANFVVPVDTTRMKEEVPSPDFVRPSVNGYRILGKLTENTSSCGQLGIRPSPTSDRTCLLPTDPGAPSGTVRLSPRFGRTLFEQVLSGTSPFKTFQIEIANREGRNRSSTTQRGLPSTLPILVKSAESFEVEARPHARIFYISL